MKVEINVAWKDAHEFATTSKGRIIPYMSVFSGKIRYSTPGFYWCEICKVWFTYDDSGWVTCWCV